MDQIKDLIDKIKADTNERDDDNNGLNEYVLRIISISKENDYYSQEFCDLFRNLECLHDVKPNKVLLILLDARFGKFCRLFINFYRNEFDLDALKHETFVYFLKSMTDYVRSHEAFASKLTESGTIQAISKLIEDTDRFQNTNFVQTLNSCVLLMTRLSYYKFSRKIFKELKTKKYLIEILVDHTIQMEKYQFYLCLTNLLDQETEDKSKDSFLFNFFKQFLNTKCSYELKTQEFVYNNDETFDIKDIEMSLYELYNYFNEDWENWKEGQSNEIKEWLNKVIHRVKLTETIYENYNKEEEEKVTDVNHKQVNQKITEFGELIKSNCNKMTCESILQKFKQDPSLTETYYRMLNQNNKLEEMNIEFKNSLETKNSYKSYDKMIIYLQISRHLLDYSPRYQELINNNFEYLHPFMLILTKNDYLTKNQLVQNALVCFYKSCKNRNFKMEIMEAERMRLVEIFDMLDKHAKFDNIIFNLYFFMGFSLVCNHEEFSRVLHEKNCKEYVDCVFHVLSKLKIDKNNRFLHSFTLDARSPTIYSHEILNSLVKFVDIEYVKQGLMNNNFLNMLMKHYKQIKNDIYGERELIITLITQFSSLISSNRSSININELNEILQINLDNNYLISFTKAILNNISNDADGTVETFEVNQNELTKFKYEVVNQNKTRQIVAQIIDFLRFMQPLESETDEKLNLCRLCLEVLKSKNNYHKPLICVIKEKNFFDCIQVYIQNYISLFKNNRTTDAITKFIVELFDLVVEFIEISKEFQEMFMNSDLLNRLFELFSSHAFCLNITETIQIQKIAHTEKILASSIQIFYWLCENRDFFIQSTSVSTQMLELVITSYHTLEKCKCQETLVLIIFHLIDEHNFTKLDKSLLECLINKLFDLIINCISKKSTNFEGKLTYKINCYTNLCCSLDTVLRLLNTLMIHTFFEEIACNMCETLVISLVELYRISSNEDEQLYLNQLLSTFLSSMTKFNKHSSRDRIKNDEKFMRVLEQNQKHSNKELRESAEVLLWTLK